MLPTADAAAYLQQPFDQASQAIQSQTPAIQNLYAALIQGLQAQGAAQTQNVVNSAQARGVGRGTLAGDVQSQLGQALALQTGQLGFQQAQDLSGVQQNLGQLGVQRVGRVADLAQSLQQNALMQQQAQVRQQQAQREAQLKMQQADRDFEVSKAASSRRAAEKKQAELTTSQALLTVGQLWQPGKDGYVNPKQWNELRKAFMEAGYSGSSFDSEFGNLVNPVHLYRENQKKLPRYDGVKLKD